MKRLVLFVLLLCCVTNRVMASNDLERRIQQQREANARLVAELGTKTAALLIKDHDAFLGVAGKLFTTIFDRLNGFPASRLVTYEMNGGRRPHHREGGGLPYGCGYFVEVSYLKAELESDPFTAAWSAGGVHLGTRLSTKAKVQVRSFAHPPACPYVRNCRVCFTPLPGVCCDTGTSCDDHWCAGGGHELPNIGAYGRASANPAAQFGIASPSANQFLIVTALGEKAALNVAELAARTGLSPAVVAAETNSLQMAGLIVTSPRLDLAGAALEARDHLTSLAMYRVDRDPLHLDAEIGATIQYPTLDGVKDFPIRKTASFDLPAGDPYRGGIHLGASLVGPVTFPTSVRTQGGRPLPARDYWFQVGVDEVKTTAWGLEASASAGAQWNDVHLVERLLRIHYVDVGSGDAIWIQTPRRLDGTGGENILVDGGPTADDPTTPEIENRALLYLRTMGLPEGSRIDYLVLTHPARDHIKGLMDILDRYEVATIVDPGLHGGHHYSRFVERARRETVNGQPSQYITQPTIDTIRLAAPLAARILYSDRKDAALGRRGIRAKNASIVLKLSYGSHSYLFTGDAKGSRRRHQEIAFVEKLLLDESAATLPATILKAGDHGADDSSHQAFLTAVRPAAIVISAGRRPANFLGTRYLPDQATLTRIAATLPAATVLRTDADDATAHRSTRNDADGDDVLALADDASVALYQARLVNEVFTWELVRRIP